jgi:hypothetical protein
MKKNRMLKVPVKMFLPPVQGPLRVTAAPWAKPKSPPLQQLPAPAIKK